MLALDAPRASSPDPSSPSGSDASSPRSILRPSGSFMRKSAQGPSAASRDARRRAREAARRASLDAVAERAPRLEARSSPSPSPAPAPDPEAPLDTPRGARPDRAPPTVATTVGATTPDGIENPPEPAPRADPPADPPADPREPSPASPPSTPASLVATLANALADLERELIALAAPEPKRRSSSSSPGGIDDGAESNAEDARASVRDAARRASDLCADLGLADAAKRLEQPPSPDSVHQLDASFDSEDGEGWVLEKTTNDARPGAEEEEEEDASADDARAREEDAPAGFPAASKASLALDFDAAADDAPAVATYLSSDDAGSIIGGDRVEDRFEDRFEDRRSDGFARRTARVRFSDCSLWAVHDIGSVRDLRREKRGGLVGAVAGWVKAETRALVSSLKGSGGAGEEEEAFKASIRRALRLGRRNMLENVDYNAAFSETADRATCTGGGGDGGTYYF